MILVLESYSHHLDETKCIPTEQPKSTKQIKSKRTKESQSNTYLTSTEKMNSLHKDEFSIADYGYDEFEYDGNEERVIEWIHDCQQPLVNLIDDELRHLSTDPPSWIWLTTDNTTSSTAPQENLLQLEDSEERNNEISNPSDPKEPRPEHQQRQPHSRTSSIGIFPFLSH